MNNIHLFICSYLGAEFLKSAKHLTELSSDINIHILDNGAQQFEHLSRNVLHKTKINIGCAGIWNLAARIGFEYFKADKIIISNDDNIFSDFNIKTLYQLTNENTIVGLYDRSFEFSAFGLHKSVYNQVGEFDENFLCVTDEDTDYKYRCKLNNINIRSLGISADNNKSLSSKILDDAVSKKIMFDYRTNNINYINSKWGNTRNFITPFNSGKNETPLSNNLLDLYRNTYDLNDKFPSDAEFDIFKSTQK